MKKLALVVALGTLASVAVAQDAGKSGFYVGAGLMNVSGPTSLAEPKNYFFELGYSFNQSYGVEFQYSDSYSETSFDDSFTTFVDAPVNGLVDYDGSTDISLQTTALFGTYRTNGNVYFKAKAGFMKRQNTLDLSYDYVVTTGANAGDSGSISDSDDSNSENGWAAGLGGGFKFGATSALELEYVTTQDKIDLDFITLSYKYGF